MGFYASLCWFQVFLNDWAQNTSLGLVFIQFVAVFIDKHVNNNKTKHYDEVQSFSDSQVLTQVEVRMASSSIRSKYLITSRCLKCAKIPQVTCCFTQNLLFIIDSEFTDLICYIWTLALTQLCFVYFSHVMKVVII